MIRREFIVSLLALAAASHLRAQDLPVTPLAPKGTATPFSFDVVRTRASDLAAKPYAPRPMIPEAWRNLSFDEFNHIWFAERNALWNNTDAALRVDTFTSGLYIPRAVEINVVEGGLSQVLPYDINVFDKTDTFPDLPVDDTMGYSGFRLRAELEHPGIFTEFMVDRKSVV